MALKMSVEDKNKDEQPTAAELEYPDSRRSSR